MLKRCCHGRVGFKMRIMTSEQLSEIRNSPVFRSLAAKGRPDFSALKKEADSFAKWIARQHKKEREAQLVALP